MSRVKCPAHWLTCWLPHSCCPPIPTSVASFPLLSYSQLIAEWPVTMLLLCLAIILLCGLAGLLWGPLPDFSTPLLVRDPGEGRGKEGCGPSGWGVEVGP